MISKDSKTEGLHPFFGKMQKNTRRALIACLGAQGFFVLFIFLIKSVDIPRNGRDPVLSLSNPDDAPRIECDCGVSIAIPHGWEVFYKDSNGVIFGFRRGRRRASITVGLRGLVFISERPKSEKRPITISGHSATIQKGRSTPAGDRTATHSSFLIEMDVNGTNLDVSVDFSGEADDIPVNLFRYLESIQVRGTDDLDDSAHK